MANLKRLSLFLASPGDTEEERKIVRGVVDELNLGVARAASVYLELVQWETHARPGAGEDAQDVINRQLPAADLFLGILWRRFGSPTKRADSGTEEEFNRAYDSWHTRGKPEILFYFSRRPYFPASLEELTQLEKVMRFRSRLEKQGVLYWVYDDATYFAAFVRRHLTSAILDRGRNEASGVLQPGASSSVTELRELRSLLERVSYSLEDRARVVSLLYLDIDSFAVFNRTASNPSGDAFLDQVAHVLVSVLEGKGSVYRVSGDEFLILMPNHTAEEATATGERLRRMIAGIPPATLTASIGVACSSDEVRTGDALLRQAREALISAKVEGKDQLVASPLEPARRRRLEGIDLWEYS
jgi:diguanylate cyclase (GGDEF)-like protein